MLLDLSMIRAPHGRFAKSYQPEAFRTTFNDDRETFEVVDPVSLAFDIDKDKQQFRLVGSVRTTLQLPCSRCLESFTQPVDTDFDLRYQPHAANSGEGEKEIEEDDLTTAFYQNDQIDLGQLLREQFYLSVPMKPLCRVDCRGLCPVCGTNLNRETCDCKPAWDDPRLAALKAWQERKE